jgi:L-proline amide hydrolase
METTVGWRGLQTWVHMDGGPSRHALVTLHGGPGLPSDYLDPLARLATRDRMVVRYDQVGCGKSAGPEDDSLWVMGTFVDELEAVLTGLGLESFVLLGHSWGGWLALQYVLERRPRGLIGLVLASSCSSIPEFGRTTRGLKAELPEEVQAVIDRHEAAGTTDSEEYNDAFMEYATRWLIRSEIPESLLASIAGQNDHIYAVMQGPEWNVIGNLKNWDVTDRLGEIDVPVLATSGRFDEMTPQLVASMVDRIQDAEWVLFEKSAHMAFLEETNRYLEVLGGFLARVEAAAGISTG